MKRFGFKIEIKVGFLGARREATLVGFVDFERR